MKRLFLTLIVLNVFAALTALAKPSAKLEARIFEEISKQLPASLGLVSVSLPEKTSASDDASILISWTGAAREGIFDLQVQLKDKKGSKKVWARVELRPMQDALVTTRAIKAGEALQQGDIAFEKRPARDGTFLSMDPTCLTGLTTQSDLETGALLTQESVSLPPKVARGSDVVILVQRGGLCIKASGVLEEPARPGEKSAARLSDGRLVKGRLRDSETFLVEGGEE